jgi:WD40 repeat protein
MGQKFYLAQWALTFSADGTMLVSGSDDKTLHFWDAILVRL